jgi:glycine/D-amino acid oxidase-like deaminating enzyme
MSNIESLWSKTAPRPSFAPLHGDIKTDVLIIGGGITGILCAYMLKKAGIDCVLVEADRIGGGITQNTTAKITLLHGLLYDSLIRKFGFDTAQRYLHAQQAAIRQYHALCQTVTCDYRERTAYTSSLRDREKIEREVLALNRLGCPATFTDTVSLPLPVKGAVGVAHQAQFHPLKFTFAMAKDLPVYEHTKVLELGPRKAVTQYGSVVSDKIIVATHFPMLNKHGLYPLKLYQHRSYVIALKGAQNVDGMYVDESDTGLSFRSYDNLLLLGGGGHRTG